MSSIQAGDVVVCVDATPSPTNGPGNVVDLRKLRAGGMYRVSEVGVSSDKGIPFVLLAGIETGFTSWGSRRAFAIRRFRKIEKADDSFIAQIKACRPKHDRVPHNVESDRG